MGMHGQADVRTTPVCAGLRETNPVLRALYAQATTGLYDHLGVRATAMMSASIEIAVSVLGSGRRQLEQTMSGLVLLHELVTTCWPRSHAYMRNIVQVRSFLACIRPL